MAVLFQLANQLVQVRVRLPTPIQNQLIEDLPQCFGAVTFARPVQARVIEPLDRIVIPGQRTRRRRKACRFRNVAEITGDEMMYLIDLVPIL